MTHRHPAPHAAAGDPAAAGAFAGPAPVSGPLAALAAASDALATLVAEIGRSTVGVNLEGRGDGASGTVWRDGLVVTVAHPLGRGRRAVRISLADGGTVPAEVVGIDHGTDLAVLRITATAGTDAAFPAVRRGEAERVAAGHFVVAVGRSVRGDTAASAGIVHRTGAAWQTWTGGRIDRLIRLDGGLFDGLSGGPVADAAGGVIGIGNGALARGGGVVVPGGTVDRVVDELLAHGRVARPYLGIVAQPVRVPSAPAANATTAEGGTTAAAAASGLGLLITALDEQGPAVGAGLMVGDIVRSVAGVPVTDLSALRAALAGQRAGQTVALDVLRAGVPTAMTLVAGDAPAPVARGCR